MGRNYGILFSEFSPEADDPDIKVRQLETIRRELERTFSPERFEFDIIKVVSHYEDNSYPEIGVYSISGDITDEEYSSMEALVTERSASADGPVAVTTSEGVSWDAVEKHGCYPRRP